MRLPPTLTEPPPAHLPRFLADQHDRHGPIFALDSPAGPPTVYCIGPAAVREMFDRERSGALAVHNTAAVHTLFGRAVFTLRGREHAQACTFLSAGLRHTAVAAYLPTVAAIAQRHVARWAVLPTVELYQAAREYTMQVCVAAILGLATDDPTALRVPHLFDQFVAGTELPPARTTNEDAVYIAAQEAAVELRALLHAHTLRTDNGMVESVTSKLLASGRAPDNVVDHLLALLIAARETTASLITWLLIECALDDQLAASLADDARTLLAAPSGASDRGAAAGLRHVLAECTRLHTPNTVATRWATADVLIGGYDIPAGWHIAYSAPATHLLPQLFANPESFCPQRFRGPAGTRRAAGLLAFGRGEHACAGRAFAEATTLLLASVVLAAHRIDLHTDRPQVGRFQPVRTPAGPVHACVRKERA